MKAEAFVAAYPGESRRLVAVFRHVAPSLLENIWEGNTFKVTLDQTLVFSLEDESRWAIRRGLVRSDRLPDYLDYLSMDALASVRPGAVRIVR